MVYSASANDLAHLSLLLQNFLHGRTRHQLVIPSCEGRELLLVVQIRHQPPKHGVPGDPRQISIGALVTDQVLGLLLLQVGVDDTKHALDLIGIALLGTRQLLLMKGAEPGFLTEVGALTGDLEGEPLQELVLLSGAGIGEAALGVVGVDEVLDDSTRLMEVVSMIQRPAE